MSRSKVDLPEPVRPKKADDLALRDLKLDTVEHQKIAAVGLGKGVTQTVNVEERSAHVSGAHGNASAEPEFAFGVLIQRTPEHAIDDDDVQTHHGDAQHDAVEVAGIGLLRNIGAEPFGFEVLIAP